MNLGHPKKAEKDLPFLIILKVSMLPTVKSLME